MTMQPSAYGDPAPAWHVTGSTAVEYDPNGKLNPGREATVKLADGGTETVYIPANVLASPDEMRALIQAHVDSVAALHKLSG